MNFFKKTTPLELLVEYKIAFGLHGTSYIEPKWIKPESEEIIAASFFLLLSLVYYACEEKIVGDLSSTFNQYSGESHLISSAIAMDVRNSFSEIEKKAYDEEFTYPRDIPTLLLDDSSELPSREIFKTYRFAILKMGNDWIGDLKPEIGYDKLLIPLSAGIFFEYAMKHISSFRGRLYPSWGIERIIELNEENDFRSLNGCRKISNLVIKEMLAGEEVAKQRVQQKAQGISEEA